MHIGRDYYVIARKRDAHKNEYRTESAKLRKERPSLYKLAHVHFHTETLANRVRSQLPEELRNMTFVTKQADFYF